MRTILVFLTITLTIFLSISNSFAKSFLSICKAPKKLNSVIENHTKVNFPEYANDKFAFSNLKAKTGEYVNQLCSDVGKRAYHGKWHPKPC